MTVKERIAALRARMKETGIDAYLIPTDDFHGSEYVGEYFKCRKYITGFTGSAGTAVIMQDMAGLWTDGRYFIQAADQLEGTGITLFKMGEPEVPTVHEFLKKNLTQGRCLGFDGRTVSAKEAAELEKMLDENGVSLSVDHDLAGDIWENRPVLSCEPVTELDIKWAGESRADKCARIRKAMEKKGADLFVLTSLDDIAWLLNIRGGDIHCCPVVLSYLVMMENELRLYANAAAFSEEIRSNLEADGVKIYPYDDVYSYVQTISSDKKVLLSRANVNSRLVSNIPSEVTILDEPNLTLLPKAVKNKPEMENERIAHIKDGIAVTKFIHWLKKNVTRTTITELSAAEKLYQFRSEQEHFLGDSFDPIIAYGTHAAIVHYSATEATDIPLAARGMVLADTGGHYLEGTTDITRTIVVGPLTEEEKDEVRSQIGEFRKYAPLIQNGRYYRLTDPFKSEVCAWEIVGNSQEEVLLNVVMEEIHGNMTVNYVQLRGLDESALYKEQTTGRIYSGAALMHGGMPLPAEFGEYRAYQYHFVRE